MDLALFDLDHTLLPLDSDAEWGRFLARIGAVPRELHERETDRFYREYQAGTLDIQEFLASSWRRWARTLANRSRPGMRSSCARSSSRRSVRRRWNCSSATVRAAT